MRTVTEGRKMRIRSGEMSSGSFGESVRRKGGRRGVGGWSWMGGVRVPVALVM